MRHWMMVLLLFWACAQKKPPEAPPLRSVRYVVVENDSGARERTFSGQVQASKQSRMAFQVTGRVQRVAVKVGDQVKRGQLIAALDPMDFRLQLREARASLRQARAQARSAAATYSRIRALYENKNASTQDLDNARAQKDGAQSSVASILQNVRRVKRQLQYATLKAPSAGIIQQLDVETNEVVAAGQIIALLQAGQQLEVALSVPESHVNRIERGQEVTVTVNAIGDTPLAGVVSEIGIPSSNSAAFPVAVRLVEPGDKVGAGMAADVTFQFHTGETEKETYRVPPAAVAEDRKGRFVFVVERSSADAQKNEGVVRRTRVEVGGIESGGIEILSGIENGQLVVSAGTSRIYDGLRVKVPATSARTVK